MSADGRAEAPGRWQRRGDEWTEEAFAAWRAENEGGTALWRLAWDGDRVAGTVLAGLDAEATRGAAAGGA